MKSGKETNSGTSPDNAVCSLQTAYNLCTSGRGDMVVLLADSTAYAFTVSRACTLSKMGTTIIGASNGNPFFNRAKVLASGHSAALGVRNIIVVTAENVQLINLFVSNEDSTGYGGVKVSAARFYAKNCHFNGGAIVGAKQGDTLISCGLKVDNVSEGRCDDCIFGSNSTDRNPAAGDQGDIYIESAAGMGQWVFNRCITMAQTDDANHAAIKLGAATTLNGWSYFNDCIFSCWYASDASPGTSVVLNDAAQSNQGLVFNRCAKVGYDSWDTEDTDASFLVKTSTGPVDSVGTLMAQ
jgi:hypothetical protein